MLEAASTAEVRSEHPLGRAIVEHARTAGVVVTEPDGFMSVPGRGVTASLGGSQISAGTRAYLGSLSVQVNDLPPGGIIGADWPGNDLENVAAGDQAHRAEPGHRDGRGWLGAPG